MCRNIKNLFNFDPPVTDDEIRATVKFLLLHMKILVEPSGAVSRTGSATTWAYAYVSRASAAIAAPRSVSSWPPLSTMNHSTWRFTRVASLSPVTR